jgi:mercuric ion transport protein
VNGVLPNAPPARSKVTGGLAALACAACCAIPLLIAAGVLSGAGAAILQRTLVAVAAGLAVLAVGMWWLHRRQTRRAADRGETCGCGSTRPATVSTASPSGGGKSTRTPSGEHSSARWWWTMLSAPTRRSVTQVTSTRRRIGVGLKQGDGRPRSRDRACALDTPEAAPDGE